MTKGWKDDSGGERDTLLSEREWKRIWLCASVREVKNRAESGRDEKRELLCSERAQSRAVLSYTHTDCWCVDTSSAARLRLEPRRLPLTVSTQICSPSSGPPVYPFNFTLLLSLPPPPLSVLFHRSCLCLHFLSVFVSFHFISIQVPRSSNVRRSANKTNTDRRVATCAVPSHLFILIWTLNYFTGTHILACSVFLCLYVSSQAHNPVKIINVQASAFPHTFSLSFFCYPFGECRCLSSLPARPYECTHACRHVFSRVHT